jgi:hypothetical protein
VEDFIKMLAKAVVAELRSANDDGWVSQHGSLLGPRRHCAIVRRRVEAGDAEATIKPAPDRQFLLSRAAYAEEMRGMGVARPPVKALPAAAGPDEDTGVKLRLLRKLGRA